MASLSDFDAILRGHIEKKEMVSASYAVAKHGETIFENAVGFADAERQIPLRSDSIMRLASMTKPITGAAVLKARELGLLSLSDPIETYIPELGSMRVAELDSGGKVVGSHPAKTKITVLDLLNHTSGLGMGSVPQEVLGRIGKGATLASVVPGYRDQLLDFEPQSASGYSATMAFDVACRIVEIVSGKEYEAFIREHILSPLGMKDTTYTLSPEQESRLAVMYHCSDGKVVSSRPDQIILSNVPTTFKAGGAQLFSTITDYLRFANMLAGEGEFDGVSVLSSESVKIMRTPSLPAPLRGNGCEEWGISVRVITKKEPPHQPLNPGAFGWSGAYETHFFVDPSLDLSAVLFKNVSSGLGSGAITSREFETEVMKVLG